MVKQLVPAVCLIVHFLRVAPKMVLLVLGQHCCTGCEKAQLMAVSAFCQLSHAGAGGFIELLETKKGTLTVYVPRYRKF